MATKQFVFEGKCNWAKVYKPVEAFDKSKPNEYTIDLYMSDKEFDAFRDSGSQLRVKENEDGKYIRFRCPSRVLIKGEEVEFKPKVVDAHGEAFTDVIGNGSKVAVTIDVYDTRMGKGSRLREVAVIEHIPYEKEDTNEGFSAAI